MKNLSKITVVAACMLAITIAACTKRDDPDRLSLDVSPPQLTFDVDGNAPENVVTVSGSDWNASVVAGGDWITIDRISGLDGEGFTVTVTATGQAREGSIKVSSTEDATLEKTVVVKQEGPEAVSDQVANSYMVAPGGKVILPVSRAFDAWSGYFGTPVDADAELTAELLWMDTPGGISATSSIASLSMFDGEAGKDAGIRIVAGAAEGNALVALKAGEQIVWSWHIWVTGYDPETDNVTFDVPATEGMLGFPPAPALTHVLMDRNLGALNTTPGDVNSLGLSYQFGRKDPFPSADGEIPPYGEPTIATFHRTIYDAAGEELTVGWGGTGINIGLQQYLDDKEGIGYAVQNPNLYIVASSIPPITTWTTNRVYAGGGPPPPATELKKDMWGGYPATENSGNGVNMTTEKSLFDPCPAGYRVPFDSRMALTLYDMQTAGSLMIADQGMDYGQYGYFPFNGHIEADQEDAGFYHEVTMWGGIWMNWGGGYGGTLMDYDVYHGGMVGYMEETDSQLVQSQQMMMAYSAGVRCEKEW